MSFSECMAPARAVTTFLAIAGQIRSAQQFLFESADTLHRHNSLLRPRDLYIRSALSIPNRDQIPSPRPHIPSNFTQSTPRRTRCRNPPTTTIPSTPPPHPTLPPPRSPPPKTPSWPHSRSRSHRRYPRKTPPADRPRSAACPGSRAGSPARGRIPTGARRGGTRSAAWGRCLLL